MLRTDLFALAALDALRGLAATAASEDAVVVIFRVPVVEGVELVLRREEIGNDDSLGTGALLDAVATGGTGDEVLCVDDIADLADRLHLAFVEGLEVLHGSDIVLHLLHVAHTRQHHGHHGEAAGKAHRVTGVRATVQIAQDLIGA